VLCFKTFLLSNKSNKIDLAPYVGADLGVMERDSRRMRGTHPFIFTNLRTGKGLDQVIDWIECDVLLLDKQAS